MTYQIEFRPAAAREFDRLPLHVRDRIERTLEELSLDPRRPGSVPLEGAPGWRRVRVGDYRIVYAVEDDARSVLVHRIGHRRDVYGRLNR